MKHIINVVEKIEEEKNVISLSVEPKFRVIAKSDDGGISALIQNSLDVCLNNKSIM